MKNNLLYVFFTFLKIGATAFGGYMSLIAIVQKQVVEVDKKMKEEDLLDGISLVSILPGPMAVNLITYVGYRLSGLMGAILAFVGIITPSFLLVIIFSWLYFQYGNLPQIKHLFQGFMPMIVALIFTVACNMAKQQMKGHALWGIGIVSAMLLIFIGGFWMTIAAMGIGGIIGFFLFKNNSAVFDDNKVRFQLKKREWIAGITVIILFILLLFVGGMQDNSPTALKIVSVFSGSSVTLFGGGFVVIPALRELFVENLAWITDYQFVDGIAIGQITPGPIFITATFIGYKVAGFLGALLATIAMFLPPAVLTIACSRFFISLTKSAITKAVMKGVRAAVIGMIFASVYTIGKTMDFSWTSFILLIIYVIISFKYKISPVYLILASGALGLLLF